MVATLASVAERAGVSPATVSRVLNGNYPVAVDTRRRVEKAIRDLDYVVNAHARALLHSSSGMVGAIVNDISDPFFGAIAQGIQATAATMNRLVVICSSDGDPAQEIAYIEMLRRHRADAIILVGAAPEDTTYRRHLAVHARGLRSAGSRLVLCGRPAPSRSIPAQVVEFGNFDGARAITAHVIERGHRRIAYITGPSGRSTTRERLRGFRQAARASNVTVDERLIVTGDFGRESGYDAVRKLLHNGAEFTALCAANDVMAIGAMTALREAGIKVPEEVSVVGFDDIPAARDVTPALTTVRLPLAEGGRRAAAIAFVSEDLTAPVSLGFDLVLRDSVQSV